MVDTPDGATGPDGGPVRRRGPGGARVVAALVLVGAVVVLVVQNSQRVSLRFWFITGHVRLIWVIAVSLVIGGGFGLLLSGRGRRRRRRRRVASD
ncbi:MAG TPA: LapA family protein [Acidimicrobiales bacterium]|nr:LapA family protein [Acidimicrobiales bacterium]